MEMNLAENIRVFRKQRSLTQEQLAEVLGVTVGAVYKWEAKLSIPDLRLIMEMADFFDTSVDVLLGYGMKDNRQAATVLRLKKYLHDKDDAGLIEAEKALKKYPNCFEIVYNCACLYHVFGLEQDDKGKLLRALELLEFSRLLLNQNKDPVISELTIYGEMAEIYLSVNEGEQAVELLKRNNSGGIYNDLIGLTLAAVCKRPDEALPFLSEALLHNVISTVRIVSGYLNVFFERKDYEAAEEILIWSISFFDGLKYEGKVSFIDKVESMLYVCLAGTQMKSGNADCAWNSLCKAKRIAENFDAAPDYNANEIRFVSGGKTRSAYDDLGATAMDSVRKAIASMEDEELFRLWKEISGDGE